MSKRKSFSKEFKLEAIRLLELGDKSPNDLAIDLGIRRNILYKWQDQQKQHGEGAFQGSGRTDPSDEMGRLKLERDILKKPLWIQ